MARRRCARAQARCISRITSPLLPLYTGDGDGFVFVSSDTWPGAGGTLGRSKAQIAEAKATGVKPAGGAGFAYLDGPDDAIIEYQGNMPAERFNHVHMYQDEPFCAQLWYQKHLNARGGGRGPQHTEADCKVARGPDKSWPALDKDGMYRIPGAGVLFDDVSLNWYIHQGDQPLAGTLGQLYDHIALSVPEPGSLDREAESAKTSNSSSRNPTNSATRAR